ncbi:MAG TPA: tRNA (adenosine(37)-N6)-threonylcarbamoyltransferase complex dimerization subunit type 1 TsaB [Flavobacteriales bacterium]|nr:tRNA (adenosine(37)-N6)-threonylcarbamoyltransferase complex dimerization subunit type 1 TsaB [Flavobacteriales bacterium]
MALILAIETATKLCSVAVARDGVVLALRELESEKHIHAEKVHVFIAEVMEEAGLALNELDAVAVGIGPGSYTGLRIGLSAAKGLCYALDKPLIGISTLQVLVDAALRTGIQQDAVLWPMIDARRMEVFTQPYARDGKALGPVTPLVLGEEWLVTTEGDRVVFGDGADKAADLLKNAAAVYHLPGIRPSAAAAFVEAERRFAQRAFDDLAYLVPEYGKAANVAQPKKRVV